MYVYMYVCVYVCQKKTFDELYIYANINIQIHAHTHSHAHTYTITQIPELSSHVCHKWWIKRLCGFLDTHICMLYIYIYTHINIHTYTNTYIPIRARCSSHMCQWCRIYRLRCTFTYVCTHMHVHIVHAYLSARVMSASDAGSKDRGGTFITESLICSHTRWNVCICIYVCICARICMEITGLCTNCHNC
jgi:hypothetical protein